MIRGVYEPYQCSVTKSYIEREETSAVENEW